MKDSAKVATPPPRAVACSGAASGPMKSTFGADSNEAAGSRRVSAAANSAAASGWMGTRAGEPAAGPLDRGGVGVLAVGGVWLVTMVLPRSGLVALLPSPPARGVSVR